MPRKNFKVTVDGKELELCVRPPLTDELDEADRFHAATIAELIRNKKTRKLLLRQEIDAYLKETGIWTEADDQKLVELQTKVEQSLAKLRKGGMKLSDGRQIAIETMDQRIAILQHLAKRQQFDSATIENVADRERIDYFVYACTCYADSGKRYWLSIEDMKTQKNGPVYPQAYSLVFDVVFGVGSDFDKELPENKWLKKFSFVNESLEYTDRKTGVRVDRDGKPIEAKPAPEVKEETSPWVDEDGTLIEEPAAEPVKAS